jgi:hypothetical protein
MGGIPDSCGQVHLLKEGKLADKSSSFGISIRPVANPITPWRWVEGG